MNFDRISLFLAGRFSPYFQAPFDKLELIELIRDQFYDTFTDDLFKIIDSESFYSIALNKVGRQDKKDKTNKLFEIIKTLNIPEDAGGLSKKDLRGERLQELKKEYEEMQKIKKTKSNLQKRGYQFEKWVKEFFELFDLDPRASYKSKLDQIDGSFRLDGKEYLLEIKWTDKESTTEINDRMFGRLDRSLVGTIGVIISVNGFNKNAKETAKGHKNILLVSGKNISNVLSGKINLDELLRSIRRIMTEEAKAYITTYSTDAS